MPHPKRIRVFYDHFAPLYPLVDAFFRTQKKALAALLEAESSGALLDMGIGNGSNFQAYQRHRVTGVDISSQMLRKAKEKAPENATLLLADIHHLPFSDAAFDYVVLSHVLATVARPEMVLSEAARVLKPGGKLFLLNHFTPRNWWGITDRIFAPFSRLFAFRSVFYEEGLSLPSTLQKRSARSWFGGYIRLLMYERKA